MAYKKVQKRAYGLEIENTHRAGNQIEISFSVLCGRIGAVLSRYLNRIELCEVPRSYLKGWVRFVFVFVFLVAVEKEPPGR